LGLFPNGFVDVPTRGIVGIDHEPAPHVRLIGDRLDVDFVEDVDGPPRVLGRRNFDRPGFDRPRVGAESVVRGAGADIEAGVMEGQVHDRAA
jgi:hypothetical protein